MELLWLQYIALLAFSLKTVTAFQSRRRARIRWDSPPRLTQLSVVKNPPPRTVASVDNSTSITWEKENGFSPIARSRDDVIIGTRGSLLLPSLGRSGTLPLIGIASACVALAVTGVLIGPILYPRVISYPWPHAVEPNSKKEGEMTVVLAGSYNPPHSGHLAMLSYLSNRYGKVIAVIGMNPNKKYPVSPYDRAELVRTMLRDGNATNVEVQVTTGYIWRHVKKQNARIFFRGIRSWEKDGQEERQLQILNTWGPLLCGPFVWPIPTIYLEGNPAYNHVSSTLVRNMIAETSPDRTTDLEGLVPECIADEVAKLYA